MEQYTYDETNGLRQMMLLFNDVSFENDVVSLML